MGGHRRRFQPDESAADDHHAFARGDALAQLDAVIGSMQVTDRFRADVRNRQRSRACTRREHQVVVVQRRATFKVHRARGAVDTYDAMAENEADVVIVVEGARPKVRVGQRFFAGQEFLAQRRTLVGQHVVRVDQGELAVPAHRPKRGAHGETAVPRADDDDPARAHNACSSGR